MLMLLLFLISHIFVIFNLTCCCISEIDVEIDTENSLVFGPGLENADFHLPVRYFFVHLIDVKGQRLRQSPGENYLSVKSLNPNICRIWFQIIDSHDGTFIIRYKLFSTCEQLKFEITVTETGKRFAKSPYTIKGPLYNEECYCPSALDFWLNSMQCKNGDYKQLEKDLLNFSQIDSIDFSIAIDQAKSRWASHPGAYSFCHYQIISNELYRKCYGQYVGFNMFSDSIFLSLLRKVLLPNTEFFINLGDWPLEKKNFVPILSWCGSDDSKDIVLPTYDLTESTLEMMGRNSLDVFSIQGMLNMSWSSKLDVAFWRGRDSRQERLDLVKLSRQYPELVDAGLTRFFFFRDVIHEYGPEVPTVPFNEFFKYKYLINIDGTVAAYRLPYMLAGNSLVFVHDSIYYEHFYKSLQPWVHFVPFKRDLSDLVEKIQWAREHDREAQNISRNARNFVKSNLLPANVFCYYAFVLLNYTKILANVPVQPNIELEHIKQSKEALNCQCTKSFEKVEL